MNKTKICEALYALPGEVVVKRRKPLAIPAVVLLAGAAMIVLNNLYGAALSVDLRSALVFTGAVAALAGMVMVAVRLAGGDGAPFHSDGRCYLRCEELRFGRDARRQVEACIARPTTALRPCRLSSTPNWSTAPSPGCGSWGRSFPAAPRTAPGDGVLTI